MSSYPKLAGKEVAYLTERLQTYRAGTKIGPNSDLMIINAQPLSDDEIANLAAYLSSLK
jgi:cytochrome c553